MDLEQMEAMLPTEQRSGTTNPSKLVYLAIAPPKWGKTTWFCGIPNACLIASERGHQFQQTPTIFIDAWDQKKETDPYVDEEQVLHMTMRQFRRVITESDKYDFLIFDTADQFAKKCGDYHLEKHGWQHATDGGDYGKGWDIAQNTPFRQMVGAIMATGRGLAFITHSEIHTTEFKKGKQSKRETTLPGGVFKFLHTQADVILHGRFGTRRGTNKFRDRIWRTEGDEETLAGNRSKIALPEEYVVDPVDPWQQWCDFFSDPSLAAEAEKQARQLSVQKKLKQA